MNEKTTIAVEEAQTPPDVRSTVGASVIITGDISGKEDIVINGNIDGTIDFREHDVLIGDSGRINANIIAKNIIVTGEVKGELRASEQVTIKPSGRLIGDIRAPRVVLNDGCQFKGSVDMDEKAAQPPGELRNPRLQVKGARPYRVPPSAAVNRKSE